MEDLSPEGGAYPLRLLSIHESGDKRRGSGRHVQLGILLSFGKNAWLVPVIVHARGALLWRRGLLWKPHVVAPKAHDRLYCRAFCRHILSNKLREIFHVFTVPKFLGVVKSCHHYTKGLYPQPPLPALRYTRAP